MKFRLKEIREDREKRQIDIARILNIFDSNYRRYESEKSELRASQIITLCKFYGVSADYLLGFEKPLPFPTRDID